MTREEALEAITSLPEGSELFIRTGLSMDDAYPTKLRVFNEGTGLHAYFDIDRDRTGDHRNWPEGYTGAVEVFPAKRLAENRKDEL